MKTLEFIYQETAIHLLVNPNDQNVMVNATEMAKMFNKEVRYFLRLDGTKNYMKALLKKENIRADVHGYNENNTSELTEEDIVQTNYKSGTLMHRKLALKFAIWLDVDFEIWLMDIMDEVLFGKANFVKTSISKIQTAEEELQKAIESAKNEGNKDALAIIKAFENREAAKKSKDKAMRMFTSQMKMKL